MTKIIFRDTDLDIDIAEFSDYDEAKAFEALNSTDGSIVKIIEEI